MANVTAPRSSVDIGESDIAELLPSFELSLRARNRSPRTIQSYGEAVNLFRSFLVKSGWPTQATRITREHVETWLATLSERWKPTTVRIRFASLQQFFKWAAEEREIPESPMLRIRAPSVPEVPVPVPSEDTLRRILKACDGSSFEKRRDAAILRLFVDSGLRLSELTNMRLEDVEKDLVYVTGKGDRMRAVVIGTQAQLALDRYRRVRKQHPLASSPALWLGNRGVMTTSGVTQVLRRRCKQAGVEQLHPHQLRHFAAHRFLADGGTETSAQRIFGWRSRDMLARYGAARADERAAQEKRRLSPGDSL